MHRLRRHTTTAAAAQQQMQAFTLFIPSPTLGARFSALAAHSAAAAAATESLSPFSFLKN